jgi:hypothetical protein
LEYNQAINGISLAFAPPAQDSEACEIGKQINSCAIGGEGRRTTTKLPADKAFTGEFTGTLRGI